ncbi:MAG: GNAT family N-acetyltransferase [Vicinamibacterales bacterium]
MFATASLARRIERAEAQLVGESAAASALRLGPEKILRRELAGGIAVFVQEGCPFNKVAGLGFDGVPLPGELEEIEAAFAARGAAIRVEVSTLADPGVARQLTTRGYVLAGFENVLALDLTGRASPSGAAHSDIVITRADDDEGATWLDVVTTGLLHPDSFDGPPSTETFMREELERVFSDMLNAKGMERYLARRGGVIAGGGSLVIAGGVALLSGAATLPEHRKRGVQSALLSERLRIAADRGCDIAVVTTEPASKSQANVQRAGFSLLYARAVLIKDPPRVQ